MPRKNYTKNGNICRVTFELPPIVHAKKISLCGEFNDWSPKTNPMAKRNNQRFSRWFFSSATMESIDQQGRTRIPQNLITHADLKKDIVLVGVSDRAEIWSKENWEKYYGQADSQFADDQNAFEELGF